jgi:hypothetical protein
VRIIDEQRDIPYTGRLTAVLAPTESTETECECRIVGMIFDEQGTLIVDCLHSQDEINAFRITCRDNMIAAVAELPSPIARPCPPPRNQAQVADWSWKLFRSYGGL